MESVTLRFWYGGLFKNNLNDLQYLGGQERMFNVDLDELCWFWLEEFAKKCGPYEN